ncbi:MAG: PEP/pyruvate-binding domain-containing protein [Actinomycetota bacterium]
MSFLPQAGPAPLPTETFTGPPPSFWVPLGGAARDDREVGGKAAALDRLIALGAPVPITAVLTVDAYRAFIDRADLGYFVATLPSEVAPRDLAADAEKVERAFLEAPLSDDIAGSIRGAFEHVSYGAPVAVRSSGTAEDLPGASFAGQYRSFLNLGPDELERAVRLCWASLWAPGVRSYRRAQDIADTDVAMAIVIQRMVAAESSGVAFTVDPTGARAGVVRVEVVEGLGEQLVSGEATPDVFNVRREDRVPEEEHAPSFVREVAHRSLAIEDAFGRPQDIEWSVAAGSVFILQSRPVTTTVDDGFDSVPLPEVIYTSAGVGEMLPGIVPPLIWTTNAPLLEHAFTSLYGSLGISPADRSQPMLARFRGRPALNLSRLKAAARRMPGGSGAEVERQYVGKSFTPEDEEPSLAFSQRIRRLGPGLRALRMRRRLLRDGDVFIAAADLAVALDPDHSAHSISALVSYRGHLRDLARFGVATEVAVAASAAANYRGLEIALERWLRTPDTSFAAQRLTAGTVKEQAGGCDAVLALWDLHCDYCQRADVAAAVYEGPLEQVEHRLEALGRPGLDFLHHAAEGLRRAGSTSVYGGPTWEEDRDSFWATLRRCRGLHPHESPSASMSSAATGAEGFLEDLERQLTRTWRWRASRVLTGQIVDVRRRLLRRMVQDASRFLRVREAVKSAVLRIGGEERRVTREIARRLVAEGFLPRLGDELFCSDDEFVALALGERGPRPREIARRRAAFDAMSSAPPLPELFDGLPAAAPEPDVELTDNVLRGWATSPGRVMGKARVVSDLAEARDLERGEILVGRATDPSWTPLFLSAGGIVMEEGGPLSHAAIVAREFGVPAVLAAKGATRWIRTGATVVVDGTRGTVEIVEDGCAEEVA